MCARFILAAGWILVLAPRLCAAEPEVAPGDMPRVAPSEPARALETFRLKKGFRIELAAAEPHVVDPVAMAFDEESRMYVVEMRGYSERREERLGRIRLLEDPDGDGYYERSTVFAEELAWPTAILCHDGGVFVGVTPEILYLRDTNGDGVADERRVVFTGFGELATRLNVQQLLNSFRWTLDHRVHGAMGGNPSRVCRPEDGGPGLELRGRDFSFDPETFAIRAEAGGGQYGLTFDNAGRKFVCSNSQHIQALMYEHWQIPERASNPLPNPLVGIAADGGAAEVFRVSPEEPWRVIRTQWRVAGLVPGPIEGGGRSSGYFTSATGIAIYTGHALGAGFDGDAFIADVGSNLVHRKKLIEQGVGFIAERPPDERAEEFLASTDNWFRPVQIENGPDGGLYILDMYREVIEHPWSLPPNMKRLIDLNSGNDRGRIYRIVSDGFQREPPARLGKASAAVLTEALRHPNGWHRETAARLLAERKEVSAAPGLKRLAVDQSSPLGAIRALYLLARWGRLDAGLAERASGSADPSVRRHAVRLARIHLANDPRDALDWQRIVRAAAKDVSPWVRYEAAFALGSVPAAARVRALAEIAAQDSGNIWITAAVLASAAGSELEVLRELLATGNSGGQGKVIERLIQGGAKQHGDAMIREVLRELAGEGPLAVKLRTAQALAGGLGADHWKSFAALPQVHALERAAVEALSGKNARDEMEAVRFLAQCGSAEGRERLWVLFEPADVNPEVQAVAVEALLGSAGTNDGVRLIGLWSRVQPAARDRAFTLLLRRAEWAEAILDAVAAGQWRRDEMSVQQVEQLKAHPSEPVRERTSALFGQAKGAADLDRALTMPGNAERGEAVYMERCASCHRMGALGHAVGPDLVTARAAGREKLLSNILDPSRELTAGFAAYLLEGTDGESVTGVLVNEAADQVTVRQSFGYEMTLPRKEIRRLKALEQSLMPEGLMDGLDAQSVADLIEFLMKIE